MAMTNRSGDRGVPLVQPPRMANAAAGPTVEEDFCACRGQQEGDPVDPALRETQVTRQLEQERPIHRIESFGDIDLQKHTRTTSSVEELGRRVHHSEVFKDGTSTDERTLVGEDKLVHERGQTTTGAWRTAY
jgi:hypothetical protein